MKRLIVLRHATTEPTSPDGDAGRALTPRGRVEAEAVGRWLAEHGRLPDTVLCSSATRVRETWAGVQRGLGVLPPVSFDRTIYLADAARLRRELDEVDPMFDTVLLIAHNPSVTHLAFDLTEQSDPDGRERLRAGFRPASVAVFELEPRDDTEPGIGRARLLDFTHADALG